MQRHYLRREGRGRRRSEEESGGGAKLKFGEEVETFFFSRPHMEGTVRTKAAGFIILCRKLID